MDALDLLKSEHHKIHELFLEAMGSDDSARRRALLYRIRLELEVHAFVEETIFYPAFSDFPGFSELLTSALNQDHEVSRLLSMLNATPEGRIEATRSLAALREAVERHTIEEEQVLFPRIREVMRRFEREVLGRRMQAARNEKSFAA